jgi:translation initiation factor eIF-2B subunit delta
MFTLFLGNPEELVDISNRSLSERLPSNLQSLAFNTSQLTVSPSLSGWKDIQALKLLNLTYDITPAKFITMVCCELGQIPSTLVLSVLRTQHQ